MSEPRPLESLYVRANILKDRITAEQGDSAEELERFFEGGRRRDFGQSIETVAGERIVNKLSRFIVLGKPGAGKTTYLRYLTLMMLKPNSRIEERKLPIFITLREFADTQMELLDYIVQQFNVCDFDNARSFVEHMLNAGVCIVLFDGLDEVSQDADQSGIIRQVKRFCDKYSENKCVISCRVAAYNRQFDRFHDVEMADFNEEQKEKFIQNWFYDEPNTAKNCWERLKEISQLKELASVPLLLTLICIAYNRRKKFPANRSELYEEAIDALLRDWDATRDINRDEVYKHLSQKYKKSMFARIAWGTFKENIYFIPERVLMKQIEQYIKNLPGFDSNELEPDSYSILKAMEAHHGIFVERAKKVHSFAHLTFQEYFTAKYIVDNSRNDLLESLVDEYLNVDKWLEVFILASEMLDSADELLLLMQRKNLNYIKNNSYIKNFLIVVQSSILLRKSHYKKESREAVALYIIFDSALARGRTLASTFDIKLIGEDDLIRAHNISRDLVRELTQTHDRDFTSALNNSLINSLLLSFALDSEPIASLIKQENSMSRQNIEKLIEYLKANLWLVKCLNSGAYISQKVRERILSDLFKPIED